MKALGATGAFWVYGVMCTVECVLVWRMLPETKGRTLEETERELLGGRMRKVL